MYQPQVDKLENDILTYRAAVSFKAGDNSEPVFGAAWFESRVEIDRVERLVHMASVSVTGTRFPEGSKHIKAEFDQVVAERMPGWNIDVSLDDLLTSLEAAGGQIATANDLNMNPPDIFYRDHPAVLIMLDGEPVLREIENSPYKAVINTPYPLIADERMKAYYLNVAQDVWYRANKATGPYSYLDRPPKDIAGMIDPSEMEDSNEVVNAQNAPEIVVSTKPAELIVTEGEAKFELLINDLLVISNSASDIFMTVSQQKYYIVLSGRWYESLSIQGPWVYVASDQLPSVFKEIPVDSKQSESALLTAA